jgi:hypothetical protein
VGATVRGANCRGLHDLGRVRTVEQRDVNRAVERARRVRLPEGAMILQMFPQDFVVDGHPGHRDPRRMIAGQIEANVHLVMTSQREHECLVTAVNQAHLAVEETVFEALAACYAAVLPEDRREGAAVLNIGAQSSELVVYYGDALQLACQPAHLRRPFHARCGARFVHRLRGCRHPQARIRLRQGRCHGGKFFRRSGLPRGSRRAAPNAESHSGIPRPGSLSRWCSGSWPASACKAR